MKHRFFVGSKDIVADEIVLKDENAAHAFVLRLAIGEEVVICDGSAIDYHCVITSCTKLETRAKVVHKLQNMSEPSIAITLFQALPKAGKMDEIVEKCTQLGISRIVPVITARCITKISDRDIKKINRLQKIAQSAASQSQRGKIPQINSAVTFETALQEAKAHDAIFVCYEAEEQLSLRAFLQGQSQSLSSVAFFIGPEGGFEDNEIAKFKENGVATVSLGARILRTELAGVVVLSNIIYELDLI